MDKVVPNSNFVGRFLVKLICTLKFKYLSTQTQEVLTHQLLFLLSTNLWSICTIQVEMFRQNCLTNFCAKVVVYKLPYLGRVSTKLTKQFLMTLVPIPLHNVYVPMLLECQEKYCQKVLCSISNLTQAMICVFFPQSQVLKGLQMIQQNCCN